MLRNVSCQDNVDTSEIEDTQPVEPTEDDLLQLDLRFGLDEVASAEVELLRSMPRRRPTKRELLRIALKLYDYRRLRDRMFDEKKLFGEPAWDMLLALYALPSRGMALGVISLGHAANIPPTTGLRWQKVLESLGWIERGPSVGDSRQQLVRLTSLGRARMTKYLIRFYFCEGSLGADPDLSIS